MFAGAVVMNKIIKFPNSCDVISYRSRKPKRKKIKPVDILEYAKDAKLKSVIVIGVGTNGLYVASNEAKEVAHFMLSRAQDFLKRDDIE